MWLRNRRSGMGELTDREIDSLVAEKVMGIVGSGSI